MIAYLRSDGGGGNIAPECLQAKTADDAFTGAKAAGDIDAMTATLIYRALERNTGAVGQRSDACTSFTPTKCVASFSRGLGDTIWLNYCCALHSPEVAALKQHQDRAGDGAAAENKEITLELARQIASIGGG